jgi:drug/metabolite transporter (DMT)-like permease
MSLKNSFHPYAFLTIVCWSLAHVFTRVTMSYFSASGLGFWRYAFAAAALIVVAIVGKVKPPKRQDFPWFLAAGFTGFFFYMIAFNSGQGAVSAATGSVVVSAIPVMTALFAHFVYHEALRPIQWVAIALSFLGVAVLTLMNGVLTVNHGVLWLLVGSVSLSIYNLLQRKLTRTYSSLQTSTYCIFLGTIMLCLFAPTGIREAAHIPGYLWVYLAILGVISSALAYVSWSKALSMAEKTSQVSCYMFLTPFVTSILGFVISRELPDQATVFGGIIILAGVLLFNLAGLHAGKAPSPAESAQH